jgi:glycosyltransferase involved in cell wall biosynthesis
VSRALLAPELDATDQEAQAAFRARYGSGTATPIVVVIAAYEEAASIGGVLDELPLEWRGLGVTRLVVVDGGNDETASVATTHGARVCSLAINRGQGASLRLGYALARELGAHYIVTTDADGQYVGSEVGLLLDPLITGDADFATGSRWLGRQETTDRVRRLGSRFFARLASVLTGQRISDTSFGFRAMTAEVTAAVTLRQPQYQSSELLMEVLAKGFRVVEVPMTIRQRSHGETKKGGWMRYGTRYGRVLIGTWLRERHRKRADLSNAGVHSTSDAER